MTLEREPGQKRLEILKGEELDASRVIGQILYGKGTKLATITVDDGESIHCNETIDFDPTTINRRSGRVLNLQNYDQIKVVQVDMGPTTVYSAPSLRSDELSINAKLQYVDPQTQKNKDYHVGEEALLKFMTGKAGGAAVFYGEGLTDDNALIIEQPHNNETHALVVFLRPTDARWVDSEGGARVFFRSLNDQFLQNAVLPQRVRDAVRAFDHEIDTGGIKDSARIEILKSCLIAHARLAMTTGDNSHQDFVVRHLPALEQFKRGRFSQLRKPDLKRLKESVDEVMNEFIIDHDPQAPKPQVIKQPERKRKIPLKTEKAKLIYDFYHEKLGRDFGNVDEICTNNYLKEMMDNYLREVVRLAGNAESLDELVDSELILKELERTKYRNVFISFRDGPSGERVLDPHNFVRSEGSSVRAGRVIRGNLFPAIDTKKARLNREAIENALKNDQPRS